jgi:hypothetical protein
MVNSVQPDALLVTEAPSAPPPPVAGAGAAGSVGAAVFGALA